MKTLTLWIALSISFFGSLSVMAEDADGKFAIKGVGNQSCPVFVRELEEGTHNRYLFAGWLNGYITASNQHLKQTFDLSSWENINTLSNYIVQYCKKNPNHSFYVASAQVLGALYEYRMQGFSRLLTLQNETERSFVYETVLVDVQKELKKTGIYTGEVSGKFDKPTVQAIKKFQEDKNLNVNGMPDQYTLHALLRQ